MLDSRAIHKAQSLAHAIIADCPDDWQEAYDQIRLIIDELERHADDLRAKPGVQ